MERLSSWPSWISARARSHSRLGPEGQKGHLITNALARPFLHLLISTRRPRRARQLHFFRDQLEPPVHSLTRSTTCHLRAPRPSFLGEARGESSGLVA